LFDGVGGKTFHVFATDASIASAMNISTHPHPR
jgi:hypothetical protein